MGYWLLVAGSIICHHIEKKGDVKGNRSKPTRLPCKVRAGRWRAGSRRSLRPVGFLLVGHTSRRGLRPVRTESRREVAEEMVFIARKQFSYSTRP